jgi:acyl carrier protein
VNTDPSTALSGALRADLLAFIDAEVSSGNEPAEHDTDLLMSGLVDSLGVVRIVDWLESRLSIEIDPSDVVLEHFISVDAMIDYLRGRGDVDVS